MIEKARFDLRDTILVSGILNAAAFLTAPGIARQVHPLYCDGVPTGEYEDFFTAFAIDDAHVLGLVGVCPGDGGASPLLSEYENSTIWREPIH
jgi:hypothetical protein